MSHHSLVRLCHAGSQEGGRPASHCNEADSVPPLGACSSHSRCMNRVRMIGVSACSALAPARCSCTSSGDWGRDPAAARAEAAGSAAPRRHLVATVYSDLHRHFAGARAAAAATAPEHSFSAPASALPSSFLAAWHRETCCALATAPFAPFCGIRIDVAPGMCFVLVTGYRVRGNRLTNTPSACGSPCKKKE